MLVRNNSISSIISQERVGRPSPHFGWHRHPHPSGQFFNKKHPQFFSTRLLNLSISNYCWTPWSSIFSTSVEPAIFSYRRDFQDDSTQLVIMIQYCQTSGREQMHIIREQMQFDIIFPFIVISRLSALFKIRKN